MQEKSNSLTVFTDGGARGNPGPSGIGVFVLDAHQQEVYRLVHFLGVKTNNEAEYMAFGLALDFLQDYLKDHSEIKQVFFKLDSKLVVEQMNRRWKIKEPRLLELAQAHWKKIATLPFSITIQYIPRELNAMADMLANQAMDEAEKLV